MVTNTVSARARRAAITTKLPATDPAVYKPPGVIVPPVAV